MAKPYFVTSKLIFTDDKIHDTKKYTLIHMNTFQNRKLFIVADTIYKNVKQKMTKIFLHP